MFKAKYGAQNHDRGDGVLESQVWVRLDNARLNLLLGVNGGGRVVTKSVFAFVSAHTRQHENCGVQQTLTVVQFAKLVEQVKSVLDGLLDQLDLLGILVAHHRNFQRTCTVTFKIGEGAEHQQRLGVRVLIFQDSSVEASFFCEFLRSDKVAPLDELLGVCEPRFMNADTFHDVRFKTVLWREVDVVVDQIVFRVFQRLDLLIVNLLFFIS